MFTNWLVGYTKQTNKLNDGGYNMDSLLAKMTSLSY